MITVKSRQRADALQRIVQKMRIHLGHQRIVLGPFLLHTCIGKSLNRYVQLIDQFIKGVLQIPHFIVRRNLHLGQRIRTRTVYLPDLSNHRIDVLRLGPCQPSGEEHGQSQRKQSIQNELRDHITHSFHQLSLRFEHNNGPSVSHFCPRADQIFSPADLSRPLLQNRTVFLCLLPERLRAGEQLTVLINYEFTFVCRSDTLIHILQILTVQLQNKCPQIIGSIGIDDILDHIDRIRLIRK